MNKASDLSENTPRLTETCANEKHPNLCQACGGSNVPGAGNGLIRLSLTRWQECDHNDKPESRVVVLCNVCAKLLIKPHPRLYVALDPFAPFPGCMPICVECILRVGVSCSSRKTKLNGGPGVRLTMPEPSRGFVDGRNYSGPIVLYRGPVESCDERKAS